MNIPIVVRIIADGLIASEGEAAVVDKLIRAGVPAADAPEVFRTVKTACQQGVQSVITDGASCPDGPPKDPLLAEAFRAGQESIQTATRDSLIGGLVKPLLIAAVVGLLIYLILRR
jgi:hypothetical protein